MNRSRSLTLAFRARLLASVLLLASVPASLQAELLLSITQEGAPAGKLLEGGRPLQVEVQDAAADTDPGQRDQIVVTATRTGSADSETFELLETAPSSGVFAGSLALAKYLESGPGLLEAGPLPATVAVTYESAEAPGETAAASVEVIEALVELIDAFGRPAATVSTEVRLRLTERFYQAIIGIGGYWVAVAVDSLDQEYLPVYAASPGVYESAPLAIVGDGSPGDGALTAAAGSTLTASHTLTTTVTASATVGATIELIEARGLRPAATFLIGERLGIEARIPPSEAAALLPGIEAEIRTDLANDLETVQLTRTAPGVFRGAIAAAYSQGAPAVTGNGVLEEANLDLVRVSLSGGLVAASGEAQIAGAARLELLDAAGAPASRFGSGETVLVRVSDFTSADLSGGLDVLIAEASCGGALGLERLRLRETAGSSHVFEARLPVAVGSPVALNGRLECPPSHLTMRFAFENPSGAALSAEAELADAAIFFVDAGGALATEALDGRRARVRVVSSPANQNPNAFDEVDVDVTGLHTGDTQLLALRETTLSSGIFEGEVLISSRLPGNPDQVDVTAGAPPLYSHDRLLAAYAGATAAAEVIPARLTLRDQAGRELQRILPNTVPFARLEMPLLGSPIHYDTAMAEIGRPYGGTLYWPLYETDIDSGIFTSPYGLEYFQFAPGEQLAVFFTVPNGERLWKLLPVVGFEARFLDAAGSPVTTLSPHRPVTLELATPGGFAFPELRVATERGGDAEILQLDPQDEGGTIYRGTLPLRLASAVPGDGTLEANGAFPFGDTVTVELSGTPGILVSAPLLGPSLRFLGADGREETRLVTGRRYQIELDDAAANLDPLARESLSVALLSTDDPVDYPVATVAVHESGRATGIFRGSFQILGPDGGCPASVTCFHVHPGMALFARYVPASGVGAIEVHATTVGQQHLALIDDLGRTVHEVLEGAPIRVRLTDASQVSGQLETRLVTAGSRRKGDLETLTVHETTPSSGVFEGALPTRFLLEAQAGHWEDGELALGADPLSLLLTRETVVLRHAAGGEALEVAAPTVPARLSVLDAGKPASAILPGLHPRILRLECPSLAVAGLPADFTVETDYGDLETFTVMANGEGIFELPLPFGSSSAYPLDGMISIEAGQLVTFHHELTNGHLGRLSMALPVAAAQLRFVDPETGEPLARSPDLRPFTIQLIESEVQGEWPYSTRNVTLKTALGGDLETVELVAVDPAVFEGTVTPRIATGSPQPGVLEVGRQASPAGNLYDVVTVSMPIDSTEISVSLPLSGPRAVFTDVVGNEVDTIAFGIVAHVLVDDPWLDTDPLLADTVTLRIDEAAGSSEALVLEETGANTGVFRGGLPVVNAEAVAGNGVLEPLAGSFVQLVYDMPGGFGSIAAQARVLAEHLSFLDAAGLPAGSFLEGQTLRLRLVRSNPGSSPTYAEQIPVEVRSVHFGHDVETVVLVETTPDSQVYEGELPTAPGPAEPGNGRLELGHGAIPEKALASYGEASATATFSAGSLRFLDRLGRAMETLVPGQILGVELTRMAGTDPHQVDVLQEAIRLSSPYPLGVDNDIEFLTVVETGPATGVFRAFIPTRAGYSSESGYLEIYPGAPQMGARFEDASSSFEAFIGIGEGTAPTLNYDQVRLAAGASATVDVLANDVPADGGTLTLAGVIGSEALEATAGSDGLLTVSARADAVAGLHQLTYLVTDSAGLIFEGYLYVEIVSPPEVYIYEPLDGAVFAEWQMVLLDGYTYDLEDGYLSEQLQWSSDIQPSFSAIGQRYEAAAGELIRGTHVITTQVTDSDGNLGSAAVTITIDGAPILEITYPGDGTGVLQPGPLTLTATWSDEDANLGPDIHWTDGEHIYLGSGTSVTIDLQPGIRHNIIATVSDSAGNYTSVSRELWINAPPEIYILEPLDGAVFAEWQPVILDGYAYDPEDFHLNDQIQWSSDIQPSFSAYGHYEAAPGELIPGTHVITAQVADSAGSIVSATVTITIDGAPIFEITHPAAGTTVLQAGPQTLTATWSDEDADLGPDIHWYDGDEAFLGTGTPLTVDLEPGMRHTIIATVGDSAGNYVTVFREVWVNGQPSIAFAEPLDGVRIAEGEPLVVAVHAYDLEDGVPAIEWRLDGQLVPTETNLGAEFAELSRGPHTLTIRAVDSHQAEVTISASFVVVAAPQVTLLAPTSRLTVAQGDTVTFTASATDFEDGDISASIGWQTEVAWLGDGASLSTSELELGIHIVTAVVHDSDQLRGAASVEIEVRKRPIVYISSPYWGSVFPSGTPVELGSNAYDGDGNVLSGQVVWSSDRDGFLGTGSPFSTSALSVGQHEILATVTDSHGLTAVETLRISIVSSNGAPVVAIVFPETDVRIPIGLSLGILATAIDAESGDLSAGIVWTSSLAGTIGSGPEFSTQNLQAGSHTITATVADPGGLSGSASLVVRVSVPATATFVSIGPEDGFVLESGENTGAGGIASTGQLRLGDNLADRQYRSFLSFDTSALPDDALIRSVRVRAQRSGITGTNPATTHGQLTVDVKQGFFGASAALQNDDFAAAATADAVCVMTPATANGQWSSGHFGPAGLAAVNLEGLTQLRLQLALDDDDDGANDFLDHYGGESTVASTRPQLIVEYLP